VTPKGLLHISNMLVYPCFRHPTCPETSLALVPRLEHMMSQGRPWLMMDEMRSRQREVNAWSKSQSQKIHSTRVSFCVPISVHQHIRALLLAA
jgi:hypothetical protein